MKQAVVGGFGAVVTAAAAAVKSAIPLGIELEQNLDGTEAVFGELQKLAENAYKMEIKKYILNDFLTCFTVF